VALLTIMVEQVETVTCYLNGNIERIYCSRSKWALFFEVIICPGNRAANSGYFLLVVNMLGEVLNII